LKKKDLNYYNFLYFLATRELLETRSILPPKALWAALWLTSGVWFGNTM